MTQDRIPAPDMRALWKSQPREIEPMALEKVRADARKSQRRLTRAMAIEFAACLVVVAGFGPAVLHGPSPFIRAGGVVAMIWVVVYMWRWIRAFGPRRLPDDALACLDFYRSELVRMRRAMLRSWTWALAPVLVMSALIGVGRWTGPPLMGRTPAVDHLIILVSAVMVVESLVLTWLWMLHRADRLQDRIDELDALEGRP